MHHLFCVATEVLEPLTRRVELVPPDPDWPQEFARENTRIREACAPVDIALEHIGSTSVPGLAAKPTIDILGLVTQLEEVESCIPRLAALGYRYKPEHEQVLPDRRYFSKKVGGRSTHHLHIYARSSPFWGRYLLFRNYLRAHPETAHECEQLKRELVAKYEGDPEAYTAGKAEFVAAVLATCEHEEASTSRWGLAGGTPQKVQL
jgi:GrpB-like predicted nucleotidyltransferase (UPF0157 family)